MCDDVIQRLVGCVSRKLLFFHEFFDSLFQYLIIGLYIRACFSFIRRILVLMAIVIFRWQHLKTTPHLDIPLDWFVGEMKFSKM